MSWTIRGTGPVPTIEIDGIVVVTPPPAPPGTPPGIPPGPVITPTPGYPTHPFEWPSGGPLRAAYDYERVRWSWRIPGRPEDDPGARMYAMDQSEGNPSFNSHQNAGIIREGPQAAYRLWAPRDCPPALIREVLATSNLR